MGGAASAGEQLWTAVVFEAIWDPLKNLQKYTDCEFLRLRWGASTCKKLNV